MDTPLHIGNIFKATDKWLSNTMMSSLHNRCACLSLSLSLSLCVCMCVCVCVCQGTWVSLAKQKNKSDSEGVLIGTIGKGGW